MTRIQLPTSCIAADNPVVVALSQCYSSGNVRCDPTWPPRLLSKRSCAIHPTIKIASRLFSQTMQRRLLHIHEELMLPRRLRESFLQLRHCGEPCLHECLSNIIGVDVVHRFEPEVWQNHFFAASQAPENLGLEMAGRIQRFPSRSDDVPGMQQRGWESGETGFPQQVLFDCGLFNTIIAEGPARCVFGGRHLNAGAMDPDRSAM